MSDKPGTSRQNVSAFEDDEIFEDSTILANFNNSSFKDTTSRVTEANINDSLNKSGLNVSALCCDEELNGYDKLTGKTWIYPTNYPVRDYQFNIIKAALLKNTLVSLPTGLGKTFIAAVIMYNFYRWYPLGKIVFTAPTRPLVAQQITACYNIVAIPSADTVEMTGHMQVSTRKTHWQTKRVFFATPQVIYNDIKSGICPSELIRCLVIDEAHRARGNYAYCHILGTLTDMGHKTFRVLALSATPGSKVDDVISVVKNLHIAHLELRTESCIDVAAYSHARRISTVLIPLGAELTHLRDDYVEILDTYARRLKQLNILPHNLGNLSKGRIVMLYKEFQNKERGARHPQHNFIMKDFTLLIALYHGLELLTKHGSRVFLNFFDEHPEKTWIQADDRLTVLLERLRDDLGVNPLGLDRSILPDGSVPELPKDLCFGHPKFYKLKEIMLDHFNRAKQSNQDTRAIVFCEYRESVNLVHCLLLQCRPLITPQMFVGQGASGKDGKTVVSQKQQLRVMRNFREGACNVLVATCVAEEGLDVGSVDLIICFDISTRSPIRLVQRCGRTGRERGGQVYILVTEGREHQTLQDCMRQRDGLNKKIQQSKEVQASLYRANPRMLPHDFTPHCQKMHFTVTKDTEESKKGQKDLRTMLLGRGSSSSSNSSNQVDTNLITEEEFKALYPEGYNDTQYFEKLKEYWIMDRETLKSTSHCSPINLSTWLEWQRSLQNTVKVDHSKDTQILSYLLQYSDTKRFELPPSTQMPSFGTQDFATQAASSPMKVPLAKPLTPNKVQSPAKVKQTKKKQKVPLVKSPGKKDGDIRALFSTATKSTKNYTKLISDLGVKNDGSIPTSLLNLLVELNVNSNNNVQKICYICDNVCDCTIFKNLAPHKIIPPTLKSFIKEPKLPDLDLLEDLNTATILKCMKADNLENSQVIENDVSLAVGKDATKNFDLEFDFDSPMDLISPDNHNDQTDEKNDDVNDRNFDIGDIEDIFADSSPEEAIKKEIEVKNSSDPKEALGFFGLDSIDDIFADSDDSINNNTPKSVNNNSPKKLDDTLKVSPVIRDNSITNKNSTKIDKSPQRTETLSPSILSGRTKSVSMSPILCSQVRKFKLSTKKTSTPTSNVKRCLILENDNDLLTQEPQKSKSNVAQTSLADTTNKSMFTITQLVDMINTTENKSILSKSKEDKQIAIENEDERSMSPILLTQADRKKINATTKKNCSETKKSDSLIILESDSDSENDNTQVYDLDEKNSKIMDATVKSPNESKNISPVATTTPVNNKRKLSPDNDDEISTSPFFNKRPKLELDRKKLTLQQKVLAAITSNKNNTKFNNDSNINFMLSPNKIQKENKDPHRSPEKNSDDDKDEYIRKNNLEMLQMFKRGSQISNPKAKFDSLLSQRSTQVSKRKLSLEDSDDDFVDAKSGRSQKPFNGQHKNAVIKNHKVRKKKPKPNGFIDLEADLSDDHSDSGDELSDDSVGSIIDFICDENVTHHEDMQAVYMKSVKSPVKKPGVFKIPELPKRFENVDVLSQYVEEDNYEMDSFCVDSHIGLTQAHEMSDLEVAEMLLEEKRRSKRRKEDTEDSPVVVRKRKVRQIHSDSDDSSSS